MLTESALRHASGSPVSAGDGMKRAAARHNWFRPMLSTKK